MSLTRISLPRTSQARAGARWRRTVAIATTGSALLVLAACSSGDSGGSDSGDGAAGGGGDVTVGLVTKTDSNPFFVKMREAAQAAADDSGAELVALAGEFDGDNEGQVAAIENLVSQGVDGILITPNLLSGILTAISQARDAGGIVIALDTAPDPEHAVDP